MSVNPFRGYVGASPDALDDGGVGKGKIVKVKDGALAAYSLYQLGIGIWNSTKVKVDSRKYTVSVEDDDDIFPDLQVWLIDRLPAHRVHDVTAFTDQTTTVADDFETVRKVWKLLLENTGQNDQVVHLDGHRIKVNYQPPDVTAPQQQSIGQAGQSQGSRKLAGQLVFTAADLSGRNAVVRMLEGLVGKYNRIDQPTSRTFAASSWGSWKRMSGPTRGLNTVILREGVKETLLEDMKRFLNLEKRYAELGQPWHRGYLLFGPPGSGKTSVFRAIASHLHLDLYYASLSDLTKNADLVDMLGSVSERSILLLEDVDGVKATHDDDDEDQGISMSGLLNAMDGVVTPHGMILAMTTNYREKIDPRLLRRGRVDLELRVDCLGRAQLDELVQTLLKTEATFPEYNEALELSSADIVEVIKQHLDKDDPKYTVEGIRDLIETRRG